MKHRQYRPALIVADDVEDLDWVRTQENRDKSDRWMRGNVLPSIDERDGRMVIIGNWLHTDGLMARLKNTGLFTVLEFSLLREGDGTEAERCTWKAKYPTQEAIDRKRDELGDIGFRREMLLQVVPEEGQDVFPEDISYYDDPPFDDGNHLLMPGNKSAWPEVCARLNRLLGGWAAYFSHGSLAPAYQAVGPACLRPSVRFSAQTT